MNYVNIIIISGLFHDFPNETACFVTLLPTCTLIVAYPGLSDVRDNSEIIRKENENA
jgi:hypothetical protein